ncbi:MAG: hypothetical protein AAFY11_13210 [Cyanobacteria bacterium J06641_5]
MRPPISVWQRRTNDWQPAFIRENLLPLGHSAWQGYITHGRGLVACDVDESATVTLDWRRDSVAYRTQFVPAAEVRAYLTAKLLVIAAIAPITATLETYRPARDLLVSLSCNGRVEIDWLRELAIAPPDCYCLVKRRREEFDLGPRTDRRHGNDF